MYLIFWELINSDLHLSTDFCRERYQNHYQCRQMYLGREDSSSKILQHWNCMIITFQTESDLRTMCGLNSVHSTYSPARGLQEGCGTLEHVKYTCGNWRPLQARCVTCHSASASNLRTHLRACAHKTNICEPLAVHLWTSSVVQRLVRLSINWGSNI